VLKKVTKNASFAVAAIVLILLACRILISINYQRTHHPLTSEDKNYLWFVKQQDTNVLHPNDFMDLHLSLGFFKNNWNNLVKNIRIVNEIGLTRFLKWAVRGTGLVPSYEGWEACFIYDQALSAFVFTLHEDYPRAKRIFDFFEDTSRRNYDQLKYFRAFTDAYERTGKEHETWAAGPNAWILMALNYYTFETGDRSYFDLSRKIADWIVSLQSIEGGIIGGYYGNGKPMTWISSEHNFDCFAALRDYGRLWNDEFYLKRAKNIQFWFEHDAWNAKQNRFNMGRNNKFYATDQSSWAVLSLGKKYKNTFEFAYKHSQCKHLYKINNVMIEGFDFGAVYDTGPYPDKDAVWLEGTGHMVAALYVADEEQKADYFLGELKKADTRSEMHPGAMGLPYATNEGTPVFGSWLMQDKPLSVAGTSWYLFAKNRFNPFSMDQNLLPANTQIKTLRYVPDFHFVPIIDDFEYTNIKFETAYWDEYIYTYKSEITKEWADDGDGNEYMKLHYIPKKDTTSALAKVERRFMLDQDWSQYEKFSVRFRGDGSGNIVRIKVRDKEGEMYDVPLFPRSTKWETYTFRLPQDFSRDRGDGVTYGNNRFDTDGIIALLVEINSKQGEESHIGIDDLELIGKKSTPVPETMFLKKTGANTNP